MGATVGTHWHGSLAVATFCQAQPGSAARGSAQGCRWAHVWVGSADQDSCTLHLLSDYGAEAESDFRAAAVRTRACHRDGCQKASCLLLTGMCWVHPASVCQTFSAGCNCFVVTLTHDCKQEKTTRLHFDPVVHCCCIRE